ncbi:hypothetical protein HPC49_19055 [Pyxidicoccus fallax]|nr:M57 family metalloprotease [Pyxidicoccus fallax]NPC80312.1 hypothetical protein [Pyxidicoccus fallax]
MFARSLVLAAGCIALVSGCAEPPDETREIVSNLVKAGFPADDIMVVDGKVYVGRDAEVSMAASREMLESGDTTEEQYRTTNLVSTSLTKICINGSTFTGAFSTALDLAIQNYDELPLTFAMARTPSTGCSFTINAVIQPGVVGGSAGFPSGGLPYHTINIGGGLASYSVDVIEHVITHELGHTIGFRHSDYYNRSISCGTGGDEGDAGIGAIHIPGTPTTAVVGGSLMNSCFRSVETGEFSSGDLTALRALYTPQTAFRRVLTEWDQPEANWGGFTLFVAEVNGDGRADLVWNNIGESNLTYVALSNGDGTFTRALTGWAQPESGWAGYKLHVADVTGDGRADLVWNQLSAVNRTYVARGNGNGTFTRVLTAWHQPEANWGGFTLSVAEVNGDGRADLVWNNIGESNSTYVALSNGDGTFTRALTGWTQPESGWAGYKLHVADVTGDGRADLVWNQLSGVNRTYVARGNGNGTFTRVLTAWDQPEANWGGFTLSVADITGDGKRDVVWNLLGTFNRTYTAISEL